MLMIMIVWYSDDVGDDAGVDSISFNVYHSNMQILSLI